MSAPPTFPALGIPHKKTSAATLTERHAADTVEQEATVFGKSCPTCNSTHVHRTRRHPIERILLPFVAACRCNECGRRFYSLSRSIRHGHGKLRET